MNTFPCCGCDTQSVCAHHEHLPCFKRAGELYYFNHVTLVEPLARFAVGDAVRVPPTDAQGVVESLIGPGPVFTEFIVRFALGTVRCLDIDLRAVTKEHA